MPTNPLTIDLSAVGPEVVSGELGVLTPYILETERTWYCFGCARHVPWETVVCTNCQKCPTCCGCFTCDRCHQRRDAADGPCDECGVCTWNCCTCWTCPECREQYTDGDHRCGTCSTCDDCCSCSYCTGCDVMVRSDDLCNDCERCHRCCTCETNVAFTLSHMEPTFHPSMPGEFRTNPSKRYVALEIEVAKAAAGGGHVDEVVSEWMAGVVHDGSLPQYGFEINTAPANGDKLVRQLTDFARALARQKSTVDVHCGLHVHVDARDFAHYDMRRLILLYEKIEPALFAMVPARRRHSSYCMPCGEQFGAAVRAGRMPKDSKKAIIASVYGINRDSIARQASARGDKRAEDRAFRDRLGVARGSKYDNARYTALNIHSWFYRGTVECRIHTGTTDREKLVNWAMLWAAIVDRAYAMTEAQITALSGSPEEILAGLAPTKEIAAYVHARIEKFRGDNPLADTATD